MTLRNVVKVLMIFLVIMMSSCQSDYTKLVKRELASGKQNDSLFYRLKFGQTRSYFFKNCWELNKKKLLSQGPNNGYVQAFLYPQDTTDRIHDIRMLFYPRFDPNDKIMAMDVIFSYVAWAPWNKDLHADKLLPRVQDTLMKWFPGNKFMHVKDSILVKVDGNRQIQLTEGSDRDVSVLIEDLNYKLNKLNN